MNRIILIAGLGSLLMVTGVSPAAFADSVARSEERR